MEVEWSEESLNINAIKSLVVTLQRKKERLKGTKWLQGSLTQAATTVGMQGYCQENSTNIYNRIGYCLSTKKKREDIHSCPLGLEK